jgi:hypothetical protein
MIEYILLLKPLELENGSDLGMLKASWNLDEFFGFWACRYSFGSLIVSRQDMLEHSK